MKRFSFHKTERLCSEVAVSEVFISGTSLQKYPLRMLYLKTDGGSGPALKAAFTVPKRSFKRAVDRNLLKRRMREAYRLNRGDLAGVFTDKGYRMHVVFAFYSHDIATYPEIETAMVLLLNQLRTVP
jgi:ribonuclease P protein component